MQVKKYEAPTLQEALDTIKRELGPEAIILQTKQNRRGFGLMSKGSVEVTAAVSERAIDKKKTIEKRLPDAYNQKVNSLPAKSQADIYESYLEKRIEREKLKDSVQLSLGQNTSLGTSTPAGSASTSNASKRMTAVRYAEIQDDSKTQTANEYVSSEPAIPTYDAPVAVQQAVDHYSQSRSESAESIQAELAQLKRLVEELRRERKKPEYIDSDSPLAATEALQEAFEMLLHSGVERRFAVSIMRDVARGLNIEARADQDQVLDAVAEALLTRSSTKQIFGNIANASSPEILAFVGPSGSGKTSTLAKLATDAARNRNEKIGLIRVQIPGEESVDPLTVFAKALHVPYRQVSSVDEMQVAIQDMSICQRIFIDTPGVNRKDTNSIHRIRTLLQCVPNVKTQMVLSAITRDLELHEQAKVLHAFHPESVIFTRLDEAYSPGVVFSVSNRLKIPVSVFSRGKKVTEDWESASPERIAASILNIVC
jgi:flagellar biosynthesis protein FlhF